MKYVMLKNKSIYTVLTLSIIMLCGCSKDAVNDRMFFHAKDVTIGTETNIITNPVYADFITNNICAVSADETSSEDSNITALAAIMINVNENKALFTKNVYDKIYPASTTKLLTTLMVLKYGNLEEEVTIREDNMGITVPGAKLCNFKKDDIITVETLLNGLMIYSGNDAALALAEYISGNEEAFCELMNEEAKKLGAVGTNFVNSHGLHNEDHYTTAYDLYLIFTECLKYDIFKDIIKQSSYTAYYKNIDGTEKKMKYQNTNQYLSGISEAPEGVTVFGGKTGSTSHAGDCLIMYSENEDGTAYITGVFKANNRDSLYTQMTYLLSKE